MYVTPVNRTQQSFQGYDARRLSAIAMTVNDGQIAEHMRRICSNYDVKVMLSNSERFVEDSFERVRTVCPNAKPWAQDIASVSPDGKTVSFPWIHDGLGKLLHNCLGLKDNMTRTHIAGGNYFIVRNGKSNDIIVGSHEGLMIDIADKLEPLRRLFNIDKIHKIPQPDYHIDLGIRPLKDKNILVCDDSLTLEKLRDGLEKIDNAIAKNPANIQDLMRLKSDLASVIDYFQQAIAKNPYISSEKFIWHIKSLGFNAISVPGRIYTITGKDNGRNGLMYDLNYLNAVVFENPDKGLTYITNKSVLDSILNITPEIEQQTGFSFEKMFRDSIKSYVDEKDLYFVSGENNAIDNFLTNMDAGIHCLCAEIPANI